MARPRDYRAEYRRRMERGKTKGLSRAQAAGHPKRGEPLATNRDRLPKATDQINAAIKRMSRGDTLRGAAKEAGASERQLRRFLKLRNMAARDGQRWKIYDRRPREVAVRTSSGLSIVKTNLKGAEVAGYGWSVQGKALSKHDLDLLATLDGKGVIDVNGRFHPFETDPNALLRLASSEDDAFHEIYRIL